MTVSFTSQPLIHFSRLNDALSKADGWEIGADVCLGLLRLACGRHILITSFNIKKTSLKGEGTFYHTRYFPLIPEIFNQAIAILLFPLTITLGAVGWVLLQKSASHRNAYNLYLREILGKTIFFDNKEDLENLLTSLPPEYCKELINQKTLLFLNSDSILTRRENIKEKVGGMYDAPFTLSEFQKAFQGERKCRNLTLQYA